MKTTRPNRSLTHAERSLITLLLAALALAFIVTPDANAQDAAQTLAVQVFEGLLGGESLDATSALVTPDALLHTPEGAFQGGEGAAEFAASLRNSFTDLAFTAQSSTDVGDLTLVEFVMTGTHTGPYLGLQPNCAGIEVSGMAVLRSSAAGVSEGWIDYDRQALIAQVAAYSRFDAGAGTACTGGGSAVPSGVPTCLAANECQTPF